MVGRADERLAGIGCARVEAACASGGVGIVGAIESIQAGLDVVLVVGAELPSIRLRHITPGKACGRDRRLARRC